MVVGKLNELAAQGWQLKTIYDSPAWIMNCGCCTSTYESQYVCVLYRTSDTRPRKITMVDVKCPGHEVYERHGKHTYLAMRHIDTTNVENEIHQGYIRGARMATAVDVEGQIRLGHSSCYTYEIQRTFFLFFEEFVDVSQNIPHVAYVTLASRLRLGSQ